MKELLKKLSMKQDLTIDEMHSAITHVLTQANDIESATFLTLLSAKGETAEEIVSVASSLQSMMTTVEIKQPCLDIVGTGGDGFNTVNISTGSAILAASCGVKIAKHGNRSASSMAGSADMLESAGLNLDTLPARLSDSIKKHNFGFLYAPNFHPALRKLRTLRKQMAIPTIFNLVGPLLNPCSPNLLMIGVAKKHLLDTYAKVLIQMPITRAIIFNCQGVDELCTLAPIDVIEVRDSTAAPYTVDPADYGFNYCTIGDLQGGSAADNANTIKAALNGKPGAVADSLILNAGMALYLYNTCKTIEQGISLAQASQRNGDAFRLLEQLITENHVIQQAEVAAHE